MKTKQVIEIDTISDGLDAAEMVSNKQFKAVWDVGCMSTYHPRNYHINTFMTDITFPFVYNSGVKKLIDTEKYLWRAGNENI